MMIRAISLIGLLVAQAGCALSSLEDSSPDPRLRETWQAHMESGEIAAQVIIQALARPDAASTELALRGYPRALKDAYGGYYTLGRKFVGAIGHPWFMQFATRHGLPRPALMRFTMKLLANLTEPRGGDAADRVINALSRITPAA